MKKIKLLFIYISLFSFGNSFSQEPIVLNEVVISKNINFKSILKKIKKELIKNCDTVNNNYKLTQKSQINNKSLIMVNENIELKIKSFDNKFIRKYSDSLQKKIANIDKEIFNKYIESSSPLGWISGYPVRKNLNIVNLDFIKNNKKYKYVLDKLNEQENILHFSSDSLYVGKIVFNSKTYKTSVIEYYNKKSYKFTHTSFQNLRTVNNFESSWYYRKEIVSLNFNNSFDKIQLTSLKITEEIDDFEYKTFNKKGDVIYSEKNNFSTTIILSKNE